MTRWGDKGADWVVKRFNEIMFGILAAVTLILVALMVAAFVAVVAHADVEQQAPVRRLYVHETPGPWAYESQAHPRDVLAPRGTRAARKMHRAYPGDVYRLRGSSRGRFVVTAVIDIAKAGRLYDRRFHIKRTDFFVYLDRR